MKKTIVILITLIGLCSTLVYAEKLTVARIEASPDLYGPGARGVKISPDGQRVTFLQGRLKFL